MHITLNREYSQMTEFIRLMIILLASFLSPMKVYTMINPFGWKIFLFQYKRMVSSTQNSVGDSTISNGDHIRGFCDEQRRSRSNCGPCFYPTIHQCVGFLETRMSGLLFAFTLEPSHLSLLFFENWPFNASICEHRSDSSPQRPLLLIRFVAPMLNSFGVWPFEEW